MSRKPAPPRLTLDRTLVERLETLAERMRARMPEQADRLLTELGRARLVAPEKLPADVVTLGNRVTYRDDASGREQAVTLVWPDEADIDAGRISVLTPIGVALLGLPQGARFDWETRSGEVKELTVLAVTPAEGAGA